MLSEQKPSRNEDEYFHKLDAELIKAHRAKLDAGELDLVRQTERHGLARLFDLLGRKDAVTVRATGDRCGALGPWYAPLHTLAPRRRG